MTFPDSHWLSRLGGPFFLAPVAGYSDAAFRSVCARQGAALCYTEMVSSEALTRGHAKTGTLLERADDEVEYGVQLFGSKPDTMARAAEMVSAHKPLVIDVNCGCPVPKVVRTGAGSALMKTPRLLAEIVKAMHSATDVPITVKMRLGWDESCINWREVAGLAVEAGASAVTLHARTRAQGYSGKADWPSIAAMAAELPVPVFGSGDVAGAAAAVRMLRETGCAGVMIARGAMGNPFVFAQANALLEGRPEPVVSDADVARAARGHLLLSVRFMGERSACVEFRKQFCAYTKGRLHGAALRERAVHSSTVAEFEQILTELEAGPVPS